VSTILPTTGPAKIKVETKAKGLGFEQGSGGSDVEHDNITFGVFLCYTRGKKNVNRKFSTFLLEKDFFQHSVCAGENGLHR
jgi:hypothetical protein